MVAEASPCLSAFWDERFLPSAVTGPRDLAPLARDAAIRRALEIFLSGFFSVKGVPHFEGMSGAGNGEGPFRRSRKKTRKKYFRLR